MMQRPTWAIALACLCTTAVAFAADWPCFFGPARTGIAPDTGLNKDWAAKPPRELWRVNLGDGGYAGPCVAGGKVFIVDWANGQDIVRAIDLATGRDVWRYKYPSQTRDDFGSAECTPTWSEGLLYTVSRDGLINCLKADSGTLVWSA